MPAPRQGGKALSLLEHLTAQAPAKPVNSFLGLSKYYVSARLLLQQADSYRKEGNEEQLYVMLLRFASLLLDTIRKHKDHRDTDPEYVKLRKVLNDKLIAELEQLKVILRAKDVVDPQAHSRNRPADAVQLSTSNLPGMDWGPATMAAGVGGYSTAYPSAPPIQEGPPPVMVDDLLDILQHGPSGQAPPPPPPPPGWQAQSGQGAYGGSYGASQQPALPAVPAYQPKYAPSGGDASRHALFATSSSMGRPPSAGGSGTSADNNGSSWGSSSHYSQASLLLPSNGSGRAQQQQLSRYPGLEAFQQLSIQQALPPTSGPSLQPQEVGVITVPLHQAGRPDTCGQPHGDYGSPPPPPMDAAFQLEAQKAAAAPESGGIKELVKRAAMRDVHVSVALMEEFLAYARSNTGRGIESCGILAGRLSANDSIFTITTLIIPKQQGTTDTVQALNEEEIFEVQFSQELYPLGWIHTHPTQTCFLSSVDVHTQCGYQTMLDEAVAIVMAPTDRSKKCGIFRLSTPGGLQLVQKCNLRGFHAHPETSTGQDVYELCGHVFLNPRAKHSVVDLRN